MYIHSLPHTCHLESVCCGLFKLTLRIRPVGGAAWLLRWRQPFAYFFHNSRIPELLRVWHVVQINQKAPPCLRLPLRHKRITYALLRFAAISSIPAQLSPPPARPLPSLPGVCHQFARLEIEKARNLWGNKFRAMPTTPTHPSLTPTPQEDQVLHVIDFITSLRLLKAKLLKCDSSSKGADTTCQGYRIKHKSHRKRRD